MTKNSEESKEDEKIEEKKESVYSKWKKANKIDEEEKRKSSDDEKKNEATTSKKDLENKNNSRRAEGTGRYQNNGLGSILRGVIFALSGFENPLRSEIRDKGMKLGAKYRPDWTDDCTHLV